ncbi:hypothetical protein [Dysgonomonas sp. ZJ709]|uniref:MutS-related protein n=1 Tax=Dysgonomonas sp. ZJ709 TaxID=2709797 RepID=UPI0013EC9C9A|nr:hypothetical protein [Dysgonomonas sp. ZJ709]
MTLEQVKESYSTLILAERVKLAQKKKTIFQVGTIRLVVVLACIAICYALWSNTSVVLTTIGLSFIIFLLLLKYHNKLFIQKRYSELLIENAENELKGINYDFSAFDGAAEKSDASHSYSLDLDIFGNHSIFQSINRTVTASGKDKLATTILFPSEKKKDIIARQEAIKELCSKPQLIAHFRAIGQMSETDNLDVKNFSTQFAEAKSFSQTFWRFMPYVMPCLAIIGIALYGLEIIQTLIFLIYWGILISIGAAPLKYLKSKIESLEKKLDSLQTYSELFQIIETESFNSELLKAIQQQTKKNETASSAISQLRSYSNNLYQSFTFPGILLLNPTMMWCIKYDIKIEKWISQHENDITEWFDAIAQFDSLISLAIFAYNHPDYTYPEVADTFMFEAKDLGHPMINREICVRNDVQIGTHPFFLVVTGANMAGKSTYLRTVGLNHTLACIGAPVYATSLKFYPFRLVTNLRTSDSLADNESYFFAELKRLKMIIDRLQSGEQLFIILDEILKGTNSEDKQKGSIALMKQLVSLSGNGIIATHDLILGNLEKEYPDAVKNYRFEADIKNEHLSFTYKIREGVAQNMNACFLMKKMGITGL